MNATPEWISGNVYIRSNRLESVGDCIDGHQHAFDHTTIVFTGAVRVRARRVYETYTCVACGQVWEQRRGHGPCPACGSTTPREATSTREVFVADREFRAPAHCLIKADVEHEITALEPHTEFWCVYSHREPQGRVTVDYGGWTPAYQ